jgi:hypothetical protein
MRMMAALNSPDQIAAGDAGNSGSGGRAKIIIPSPP